MLDQSPISGGASPAIVPIYMKGRSALAALLLAPACATTSAPGTYEVILPAAEAGERYVRVVLKPKGEAALSTTFSERATRFLAAGNWKQDGSRITLDLDGRKPMVFQLAGNQLVTKEWHRAEWGEKGPGVLVRVDR